MKKSIPIIILIISLIFGLFISCNTHEELQEESTIEIELRGDNKGSNGDVVIGRVKDGEYIITINPDSIKNQLTRFINSNGSNFAPVEIIEIIHYNGEYFLSATGNNHSTIVSLQLINDEFSELPGGLTCTCSGCKSTGPDSSNECIVRKDRPGGCYCTSCSEGDCIKTTTSLAEGNRIFAQ